MSTMTIYHEFMIPLGLDIDMLRCFVAVARSKSFTRAGQMVGLTQSGVSVKIRRLEERLETRIFNRTSKNLFLTLEGEKLLDYAHRILSLHDEAVQSFVAPKAKGKLRVGLIDYFLPDLLPKLLSKFRKQYPNIHLEVHTGFGLDLIPLYEKGRLDLVVTGKDNYQGKCRTLVQEPLFWVVGEDTDLPSEDNPLSLVALPSPCMFRKLATDGVETTDRRWEILFTGTSIANIQAAVQAGMGLSILPKGAMNGGLKKAPGYLGLPELPPYSIVLIADEEKENSARDYFISYLETEVSNL